MGKHISCVVLAILITMVTAKHKRDNYYWKDYVDVIPEDALLAGHGLNGQRIFIGQVPVEEKIIPGKIYENDPNIYYEFGERAWSANESIKILCTEVAENFEWVPTGIYGVNKLREERSVIIGGYQPDFLTFIGRIQLDGATEVGKVICREKTCLALYINKGGKYEEYHEYEILTYNAENENIIKDA